MHSNYLERSNTQGRKLSCQEESQGRLRITDRKSSVRVQQSLQQGKPGKGSRSGLGKGREEGIHSRLAGAELGAGDKGWARLVSESQHQEPEVGSEKG